MATTCMSGASCSPYPSFQTQGVSRHTDDWPDVTSLARSRPTLRFSRRARAASLPMEMPPVSSM